MAKLSLAPVSPALTALKDRPLAAGKDSRANALRDAISDSFSPAGGGLAQWELRVQLCTDIDRMPIDEASVEWPQDLSPFTIVARLTARPQVAWDEVRSPALVDALSFSPWHALAAHRPLGSVMRARRQVYAASVAHRAGHNGCPMHEPAGHVEAAV